MEAVYRHTDLVIADIKHMDNGRHEDFTGVGNELVLTNLKRTVDMGMKLIIRTPVVPGHNGDEHSLRAIGKFIRDELRREVVSWQLLPFRRLGTEKYESLGMEYPMEGCEPLERSESERMLRSMAEMLSRDYSLPATANL